MTNRKTTKRALVTSIISLLLCLSMLVGTTFAWFTDSVTSGNNKIVAGNLDVELEYLVDGEWVKVTESTNVFEENTLWEPGHTEVVYLKVSNLGTLALDYKLGVNIAYELTSINVAGEELKLSDYIMVGVVEDVTTAYADRDAARAALDGASVKAISEGYAKEGTLYPVNNVPADGKTEQYVALVVYMPEEVGNEANYKTGYDAPEITLGINLMATQETYEKDSFDEKYDENAIYAGIPAAQVTKVSKPITVTSAISGESYPLDVAYLFQTTEDYDSAQENSHAKWHADFVATFDQDVADGAFGLAGQYDTYSPDWLAFEVEGIEVKAGQPIRMLQTAGISMNYEELCLLVKNFQCGAFAVDAREMAGKTMTVELRIYEVEEPSAENNNSWNVETGKYQTIGSYSYTFPEAAQPSDLPVAIVTDADEYENVAINWNDQFGIYPPEGTQLESVYTFTAQDDYDAAQKSPYADWTCDYYVSLDQDLAENQLVLGGNYGSYGWIGFTAPGDIAANTATPLLQSANMKMTYEEVVLSVGTFTCGVADVNDALKGATITVELRITNPADASEYYVINSTEYTFE